MITMEENYIIVSRSMVRDLGLKGNELLVYAIIKGFSQGEQGCYYGTLSYLREMTGVTTDHTIIASLRSLQEKGLIIRDDEKIKGRPCYIAVGNTAKIAEADCKNCSSDYAKIAHNNKDNTKSNNQSIDTPSEFVPPTREEIIAYCEKSGYRIDADKFLDYYETRGWVKKNGQPVKDWKGTVRTWWKEDHPQSKPMPKPEPVGTAIPINPSRPSLEEFMSRYI